MSRQPLFMYNRHRQREREHRIRTAFNLEFNDENYATATPEFWDAWRGSEKNSTLRRQYAPAKLPANQLGLQGRKPVWVVFISKAAKEHFEAKLRRVDPEVSDTSGSTLAASPEVSNADGEIHGLGWQSLRTNTGMFLDERNKTYRSQRSPVVAWLNYNRDVYSVNVVSDTFQLTRPIPRSVTDFGEAVQWVYKNSAWRRKSERRAS